jgi:hypothetical protein
MPGSRIVTRNPELIPRLPLRRSPNPRNVYTVGFSNPELAHLNVNSRSLKWVGLMTETAAPLV